MDLQALRIEVARLLGWKFHNLSDKDDHDFTNGYWQTPVGILLPADLPNWPNDPGAVARDVLPEIVERRWCYEIISQFDGSVSCVICVNEYADLDGKDDAEATEPTFALAVCRAFVAACAAE